MNFHNGGSPTEAIEKKKPPQNNRGLPPSTSSLPEVPEQQLKALHAQVQHNHNV